MPLAGEPLNEPVNVPNLLRPGTEGKPDDVALVCAKTRLTYRNLDDLANRLAANLLAMGLEPGDRVASLMPNRTALLLHYLACQRAGLVVTPLNYRYMAPEIDHALEVSKAALLLTHVERLADLESSELAGALRHGVITYGGETAGERSFEALLEHENTGVEFPKRGVDDPSAIFFTSGSTGAPKGVTHTYRSLGYMFASIGGILGLTPDDVMLPGQSISHIAGFVLSHGALAAGARVLIARTFDGHELLPLMRENKPTVLNMLPSALHRLVHEHDAQPEDFSSLRVCRSAGDKVAAELEHAFTAMTGFPIDEGWGMTEIGLAAMSPPSGLIKEGSVGRPAPGFEMSVRAEDGEEVPAGGEGRLWIKSPTTMAGYWDNSEATFATIRDGWLDTGDVMRVDENGYLWFRGRKKQIIIHDGSNICPQDVEEALLEHAAVEEAGVIGVHDMLHGENVRAYVVLSDEADEPTIQELIDHARERIGYKAPEEIIFLKEMPMNATGKVDRVSLKKMAAELHEAE